jgi:hypothetical protein
LLSGDDAKDVAAFVEAVAGRGDISAPAPSGAKPAAADAAQTTP